MECTLIVDDDRAYQKTRKSLFESEGYAVEISGDGQSAMTHSAWQVRLPSFATCDCRRCQDKKSAVKSEGTRRLCRFSSLTAQPVSWTKAITKNWGAEDYVRRPFGPRELLARGVPRFGTIEEMMPTIWNLSRE